MIHQRHGRWMAAAMALAALAGSAFLGGCGRSTGITRTDDTTEYGNASRPELIAELKNRMEHIYTLTAKTHVEMVDQSVEHNGKFPTTEVNGQLLLKRGPDGNCQVRFSVQTLLPPTNFTFLARNEDFWILMPDFTKDPAKDGKKGTVFIGTTLRNETRSRESFSYRPQDLADVFLVDEVFDISALVYMETWKQYYILHFLRRDRPEHLYSKIWINRIGGNMSVHQIFDRSGELLVEGRFLDYRNYKSRAGDFAAPLPRRFSVIWPRDQLALHVELDNVKLNDQVRDQAFEPALPSTYRVFKLRGDDAEATPGRIEERLPTAPPVGD